MDGFRDRLNRGSSDRGSYDRYDRGSRRSSYGAPAPQPGVSVDEIAQIVEESNEKQLGVINDFFEDAKDDRFESEKQILSAIDDLIAAVNNKESQASDNTDYDSQAEGDSNTTEEILRLVTSNADLLAQFAEEQLPMLVRGSNATLSQIREKLEIQEELIRSISDDASRNAMMAQNTAQSGAASEEVMSAVSANQAVLNALRSEVAEVREEVIRTADRISAKADEDNTPLDDEDVLTKAKAEEWYKALDETIHGDCVKVYRNVQKLLEEQNSGVDAAVKKGVGGIKVLTILNTVLIVLNLAAVIAKILGFI